MHSRIEIAVVAVAAAILSASAARAETDHRYIGLKACGKCHGKELMGDQVSAWEKGPHAGAYEALKSEKAIAIGKQRGLASPPVEAAECLKCHATGHGLTTAQLDKGKPLKLSDAVQCESCHGPGSGYRKNKDMSDREVAISKGMWEPGKNQQICLDCHNDESPTFDAAKGFDFEAKKKEIAHPIPEDIKGRYLEAVRERRKGGGASKDDED